MVDVLSGDDDVAAGVVELDVELPLFQRADFTGDLVAVLNNVDDAGLGVAGDAPVREGACLRVASSDSLVLPKLLKQTGSSLRAMIAHPKQKGVDTFA